MIRFEQLPELSLYVHLPWCVRKCPYCDFNSHEQKSQLPEQAYIDALIQDLQSSLPQIWGRPVVSVFIGGGTPSLFSAQGMQRLLSEIRSLVPLIPDAEITMEANPGTFDAERFAGFRDAGVNRLSLGVQSFMDSQLHALGRVHDAEQARRAIAQAKPLFDRLNIDLIFGLPGQSLKALEAELDILSSFAPSHVSLYQLTLEPNTLFAVRPPSGLPDDDLLADMQSLVIERLAQRGLVRYEISGFAAPGQECRHNLNYWSFGDYLGIGAGAHGKLSFADRIVRTVKPRHPDGFMRQPSEGGTETPVRPEDLPFEFMLNALRLIQGVPSGRWAQTTGIQVGSHPFLLDRIGVAQSRGLMSFRPDRFQASARGIELLNDLQSLFLP